MGLLNLATLVWLGMGTLLVRVVLGVEEAHGVAVPVDVDETPTRSFRMVQKTCAERRTTSHMARDEAGKCEDGRHDGDVPKDVPRFLLAPKRVGNVLDVALVDRDPAHCSSFHGDDVITFVKREIVGQLSAAVRPVGVPHSCISPTHTNMSNHGQNRTNSNQIATMTEIKRNKLLDVAAIASLLGGVGGACLYLGAVHRSSPTVRIPTDKFNSSLYERELADLL
ncbi:hypothetical protein THAOC_19416, partial [Thalassiosira oceanica]